MTGSRASESARPFDLDSFAAERPAWIGFLETVAPAAFWPPFFSSEGYWDSRTRQQEVSDALAKEFGFGIEHVRNLATIFLRQTYTHLHFYHGTRILDEASYRKFGLCRSSIESLNATARQMFGDVEPLRRAISIFRNNGYARHNEGKVGVWYSRRALLANGSYCFRGSEYLNVLSQEMGPEFHQQMIAAGQGAVIRCAVPIDLAEPYCASMAELAVKRLFQIEDPQAPEAIYLEDHSPMLEYDIPPEWIEIEFLPD